MRRIKLTQGRYATVDDDLYDQIVAMGPWHFSYGYAVNRDKVRMHRLVLEMASVTVPRQVDHKNQRKCDNRRHNLRPATRTQNNANRGPQANNTSGYKGVFWSKDKKLWAARIGINGKPNHLGYFDTAKKAAIVYDAAALEAWGEYAWLNLPKQVHKAIAIKDANARRLRGNSSGYLGVSWHSRDHIWCAYIQVQHKLIHLGRFQSKQAAARVRDTAALKYFGDSARLNFPRAHAA